LLRIRPCRLAGLRRARRSGNCTGSIRRSRRSITRLTLAYRLHVSDQLQQLLLGNQPLERRHYRLISLYYLCFRRENRFAHIRLVDGHLLSALNRGLFAEQSFKNGSAALSVAAMTCYAPELLKQLLS